MGGDCGVIDCRLWGVGVKRLAIQFLVMLCIPVWCRFRSTIQGVPQSGKNRYYFMEAIKNYVLFI